MSRRGLFLPPFDVLADPRLVAELAVEAEEAGWDGVFLWDHLLYADPVTGDLRPVDLLRRDRRPHLADPVRPDGDAV